MKILNDILQVKDPEKSDEPKYSQSRLYLLFSVIVMLGVLIYSVVLDSPDIKIIEHATNTLFYMIVVFGGYSFSGKGLSVYNKLKSNG